MLLSCQDVRMKRVKPGSEFSVFSNTKHELAQMKNIETCYKAVLEKRDTVIINLDEKLDNLREQKWDQKT